MFHKTWCMTDVWFVVLLTQPWLSQLELTQTTSLVTLENLRRALESQEEPIKPAVPLRNSSKGCPHTRTTCWAPEHWHSDWSICWRADWQGTQIRDWKLNRILIGKRRDTLVDPYQERCRQETLVEDNELFRFDKEVEPILSVLCGKTLEFARMEVLEEEELRVMTS